MVVEVAGMEGTAKVVEEGMAADKVVAGESKSTSLIGVLWCTFGCHMVPIKALLCSTHASHSSHAYAISST